MIKIGAAILLLNAVVVAGLTGSIAYSLDWSKVL
jgi:hypothetical protein